MLVVVVSISFFRFGQNLKSLHACNRRLNFQYVDHYACLYNHFVQLQAFKQYQWWDLLYYLIHLLSFCLIISQDLVLPSVTAWLSLEQLFSSKTSCLLSQSLHEVEAWFWLFSRIQTLSLNSSLRWRSDWKEWAQKVAILQLKRCFRIILTLPAGRITFVRHLHFIVGFENFWFCSYTLFWSLLR